ncbi:hypothetical protein [Undibacterium sp. TC9W]
MSDRQNYTLDAQEMVKLSGNNKKACPNKFEQAFSVYFAGLFAK